MADGAGGPIAFLGVSRSITGRTWRERPADAATVRAHQKRLGLSEPLARALAARGVGDGAGEDYLDPTLRALFPDPSCFLDMDRAAAILADAIARGRRCVVFADYDVDGAASAALLVRYFRALGRELAIYVPDRETEGYGPSPAAFRRLKAQGADLVVTVDCGAAAHDALEAAAGLGLEVVVIDHHLMRAGAVPPAAALVNPNRPGCASGQGVLAAAGVTFVLLAALNREARRRGLFADGEGPDLRRWLDLAALGAICDVTQLTGFNRALAAQGLKVMSGWANAGLDALAETAGAKGPATTFHAGFVLGPRINAGGRIGRSDLGARLLATDDPAEAMALAQELDALNATRKLVEREALDAAIPLAEQALARDPDAAALVVAGEGWRPGVVGIVASRLRERYRRAVVVIALDAAQNVGKGSGRSQPGLNLGAAVQGAFDAGVLLAGGGHAMAAGLTVRPDRIDDLRRFLNEALAPERRRAVLADVLDLDVLITPAGADRALWRSFQAFEPFGPANPEPAFALASMRIDNPSMVRGGHVRCVLADEAGERLRAVAWRADDTDLGRRLMAGGGGVHVAGRLKPDDWTGPEAVQLEIEDLADPHRIG